MAYQLTVVGIGPGSPDYLLPVAKKTIEKANIIIGSKQSLLIFAPQGAEQRVINGDIAGLFTYIEEKILKSDIVIMVTGDPGFYSLLVALKEKFSAEIIRVIPGISSFQLAFATIGEFWQNAVVTSMHGREAPEHELVFQTGKKLAMLTDNKHNPAKIAQKLLALGWPDEARVWLCANLSRPDEQICSLTLGETINKCGFSYCVMVVME